MQNNTLQMKRALRTALLVLLLSVVWMDEGYAQTLMYTFDFSEVCFEYDRSDYLVYSLSYLEVVDYEVVYSFLDQNNIVSFSLTPVVNDGKIYFRQNSKMYVNSNTLEMSPIARVGYQNTNIFVAYTN